MFLLFQVEKNSGRDPETEAGPEGAAGFGWHGVSGHRNPQEPDWPGQSGLFQRSVSWGNWILNKQFSLINVCCHRVQHLLCIFSLTPHHKHIRCCIYSYYGSSSLPSRCPTVQVPIRASLALFICILSLSCQCIRYLTFGTLQISERLAPKPQF